jgi:amino acid adenylation domain-containing protein
MVRAAPIASLIDALAMRAEKTPDRTAYIFLAEGEEEQNRLTYAALDAQAQAIAAALGRTCPPGERALLLYPPGLDFVVAFFGCLYAGVIAVPAYPPRSLRMMPRLLAILDDARPAVALASAASLQRVRGWLERTSSAAELSWLATDEVAPAPTGWEPTAPEGGAVAFLQYTSGSTSAPKGVMVTQANLTHNQRLIQKACCHSEESVFVSWLPPYHDLGLIGNLLQATWVGAPCVLMAPIAFLQNPSRWLRAVSRYRGTTSGGPNFAYDLCVRKVPPAEIDQLDLSSWRVAFNGAEPVREETLARFTEAFAPAGFRSGALYPCYGLAEATLMVAGGCPGEEPVVREIGGRRLVGCGRVLADLSIAIVDPDSGAPSPPGAVGEILVAGGSVARGYWNRPEETAGTFDAALPDGRGSWLRTGDLGVLDNGELFVAGRLKDLIILRGRNHYPQDLETTAELSHPALQPGSTAAFAVQVEGEEQLALVVERLPRSKDGLESVAPAVRRAVAEEHEVQVYAVALVPPGTVLKTSSGKVRRRACRDLFLAGRLATLGVSLAGEEEAPGWTGEAPRGEELLALEEAGRRSMLAAYLRQEASRVLKADPARLSAQQPLTSLGLDSLAAVELEQRIADGLGVELPASGLLEGSSLDDLMERILPNLSRRATALPYRRARRTESTLAAMQKALWFEQQLTPESPVHNIVFAARLGAEVDVAALRRDLAALVGRHAALRSTVAVEAGQPVQRFAPEAELAFTTREVASAAELRAALAVEAHRPFDLERGPLFRAVSFTGAQEEQVLLLMAHHLIFDGWSLWVLLDELRLLHAAAGSGREISLPTLPAEYADFVHWQEEMLAGPAGERLWEFWRAELPNGMPPLQLPADRPVAERTWTGAVHRFPVDQELVGRLKSLAREEGTTLYTVLLAAYQALLSRTTRQPEIAVGAAVSGRSRPEFRDLVGCLFNTVPLKADLSDEPTFRGLLQQARGRLAAALAHQDYPSHRLADRLRSGREAGGASFFQTHFLYQKPQRGEVAPRLLFDGSVRLDLGGLILDVLFVDQEAARSGLELEVFEADEGIAAWFRYSMGLFDAATVERMARHFTVLLSEAMRGADRPVSDLPLLDAAERDLLLRTWSSTGRECPVTAPIHVLFAEQAARTPEKIAAICREEAVRYLELDERSGRLASRLAGLDGNLVGLMVEPDRPLLVGILGILKAGKGFVPLDPESPAERLERMVADSGLAILATDRRHLARAEEVARRSAAARVICLDGDEPDLEPLTAAGGAGDGTAYVIFTSGSTGVPKGVPITHENLMPLLLWSREIFGFGEHTRTLQSLSYAFDFGVFEILTTLLFGGTLVLRGGAERSDVDGYLQRLRRHAINTVHTTPSFFRAVAAAAVAAGERLDGLEVLHLGGEALGEGLVEEAFAVVGERCRLFNGYGPTEAAVNCALFEVSRAADWRPRGLASIPIGRPSATHRLYVLDRWMQPVPVGMPGELFVGGMCLSRGYLNRPDLTAARFVPDPFHDRTDPTDWTDRSDASGGRLYRTGDLVRFHRDGALEFLGRVDNQVKVRGYRIELEEVEAALAAHPAVGSCAVIAWRPEGGEARLVAYVAARRQPVEAAELRRFLGRTLPPYMVPASFTFLPELPLNASGKVDRRALPPPAEAPTDSRPYVAPRTPLEAALAAIWSRQLGVEKVGIHDDFFELGGHSLLGTRVVAQIRKELGVEVALRALFESATIAGLAAAVEGAGRVDLPPIRPVPRDGELPLSFAQERIWFLTQLDPDLRSYHVPRALRVRGSFVPALVEATFSEINRRHEILRTTFPAIGGRPVQVIHPPFRMALPVIDLSALSAAVREEEMRRRILVEGRRPFNLAKGPLLRLALLRLATDEHTLVITEHHLVHDGWTQGVLLRDFLTLYSAFSRGEPSPLPDLPVQYADFAVWQRQWLRDDVLERQLAWWKERLASAPTVLDLPTDRPRPAVQSFQGDQVTWVLPADLSRELRAAGRRLGATLFMSMLSAWDALLMRLSNQEDLCIGTGVANRRVVEAEGILGMVINTLVLRADLSGSPTFAELVARMREVCVGAYGHQDLPFEKLVNALRLERSLSHTPLFQIFFAFLDTPMPELEIPGLSISVLDAHNGSAKFDINVTVLLPNEQRVGLEGVSREDEITLLFEYSTDLFERTTVRRMLESFQVLLAAAVADPGLRLWDLPLLSSAERRQAVIGWNETRTVYPRDSTIQRLFEAQVDEAPEAVAVVGEGVTWSYRQLNLLANRMAHHLRNQGVGAEARVGICLDRSPELIAAVLGILKAGGVYVPLDPSYPAERLRFMLADSGVRLVVSREPLTAELPLGDIRVVDLDRDAGTLACLSGENPPLAGSADQLAYVMYTSGSTGVPKGVAVTHRAVVRLVHGTVYVRLGPAEVFLQLASVSFDASTFEIWGALLHGARLAVFPGRAPSLDELGATLEHHGVTTLWLTAGLFHQMMDERPASLAEVRQLLAGGDVLSSAHVRRVLEELPGCTLINGYGPTENTTFTCCRPQHGPQEAGTSVPIGRPIANTRVYLLDRGLQPVPVGVPGELFAGGDGLARGYLGRPALTAERFVPDPFGAEAGEPGGRLYRTGDLARRRLDGDIEFLRRIDQQVKVRGFRIELGEIEAHLARHPAVQAATAAIYEATPGDRRIVAYLVAASQPAPAADELRRFLSETLPEYMLPAAWIWLPALPLTPNGKLNRKALPQPETDRPELTVAFVAPRTGLELTLAALWSEVLGTDQVGVHDNFFDLGGHSLLATRLMARIESRLGAALPLRALFEAPTVEALAGRVNQALGAEGGRLVPLLAAGPRPADLPLSFAQERLWFIDRLEPGTPRYNIPVALHVEGPLDAAVLALCLGEIRRRHESLRTVFAELEGTPVQVIQPAAPFALPVVDLSGLPPGRREMMARLLAGDEAVRPFDLACGPLLRGLLLRLAEEDHVAALNMHHIVSDGWSMRILVREVTALYAALAAGRPSPLSELPLQYADFSVWQRSWLHGEALESEISFWRRQLAGLPPLLDLPTDRPRPAVQSFRGASRPVHLCAGLTRNLQALGRREGATLFMVLLAAFQALLVRTGGQDDLAVGTPVAGRNRVEIEELIGFFVNTLVLRADRTGSSTFRELISRVRETVLATQAHQDLPFEKLVQELSPERSLAHSPLFQVMLALQEDPLEALEIQSLRLRPVGRAGTTAKFDLTLSLGEHGGGIGGVIEYATDLFDPTTVDRLILHFETLLTAALAAPELPVSVLSVLDVVERHQLLVEWGGVGGEPCASSIHGRFEAQARQAPGATALTCGGASLSYGELNRRSNQLARRLRRLGAGPECRVGLCLERSLDLVVGILGILKAGGAYVPLDPGSPRERLAYMIEDAGIQVVVTKEHIAVLPDTVGRILLDAHRDLLETLPDGDLEPQADGASLAYVIYTSGSTGRPKGALITHGNVARLFDSTEEWFGFGERDVWTLFHSYAFDFSVWEIWGALLYGGRLVIVPWDVSRSPELFLDLVTRERVTVLNQTPSAFAQLAQVDAERGGVATDLRLVIFGGEALDPAGLAPWFARHGDAQPLLVNMYGITETTVHVTFRPLCAVDSRGERRSVIGGPLPDLSLAVMDGRLQPVPIGVPGELVVGGAGLARGYLGRPELTAERFVPDPAGGSAGARLYRSGDLGRFLARGGVEYLGRIDHQVKIRGFRIELGEIEAVLLSLAGVREAVVLALKGRSDMGPGDRRLVAYVAGDVAVEELRRSLRERLPDYMVPAAFVTLDALPLTPNGKVDRKGLPAPEWQSAADGSVAPRTPVEEVLAGIWADLLGHERVGATGHFFDLGGHSLLATQVMSRLRSTFGVEMPLRDLFEAPVLADLAVRVEAARRTDAVPPAPPLVPVPREGSLPLSFAQQRLWFIHQLEPGSPLYNMAVALRVEGPVDSGVLALALGEIVRRHEVLRTVFAARDGAPLQVIQPAEPFLLPLVDLSGLPGLSDLSDLSDRSDLNAWQARALVQEEANRPFDLTRDPLLRAMVLRMTAEDHLIALTLHHIASDGWSMGILVREIATLYAAFVEGRPSPLPELPVQYADFAAWQCSWLQGEVLEAEVSFWRRQLAGLPPRLELPTDRPRPGVQSFRGATRLVWLPAELTQQTQVLGRQEGATLYMVLLAAFQTLLARHSGQQDFAVSSPVAGRNRVEIEGPIGFFVNSLVLRSDLTGNLPGGRAGSPTVRELLGRVRETALAAYLHQDVPFEKLVQELAPERSLSHTPLFQVVLALQNAPFESLEMRNLRLQPLSVAGTTAKFDLTFGFAEHNGALIGTIEHATDLFDTSTIDRLVRHFVILLTGFVAQPDARVDEVSLLTPIEQQQMREWNTTPPAPATDLLHRRFEAQAARTPDAVALIQDLIQGNRAMTYAELNARANQLGHFLRRQGVVSGTFVGICLERSFDLVIALLGTIKAGGCYVPLDPAYPSERWTYTLQNAGIRVLLTQESLLSLLPAPEWEVLCLDRDRHRVAACSTEDPPPASALDDLLVVIYTSGSTGRPKGAALYQRSFLSLVDWYIANFDLREDDSFLLISSIAFDLTQKTVFSPLVSGGRLIIPLPGPYDPAAHVVSIARHGITRLNCTPSTFYPLLDRQEDFPLLASLRGLSLGGEPISLARLERWRRSPWCHAYIINTYGPTECTDLTSCHRLEPPGERAIVSAGRPLTEVQVWVLSHELVPVPLGVTGQMCAAGINISAGYLRQADLTAEKFLPNPFSGIPGDRMYLLGDLGRWLPNGELEYLGRTDFQIKLRGIRIEPGEIEAALVALPRVRDAVVVAREDSWKSDGSVRSDRSVGCDLKLVAYVTGDATAEELRRSLRERLPDYMVPTAFVTLDALPLTPNGKVDRKGLPAPEWQSVADSSVAPRTPVEEIVAAVYSELLSVPSVGRSDSFFDLGGHSLLATRAVSRLGAVFGVELPLRALFEEPSLAGLASRIERAIISGVAPQRPPIERVPRESEIPLSFAQRRLWFLDQLAPGRAELNIAAAARLEGPLDIVILEAALGAIERRHEILRTTFPIREDLPVQVISPAAALRLPCIDLSGLPAACREAECSRLAREEARMPFDLARGPVWRTALIRLETVDHALFLTLHHIVGDAWSMGILVRELGVLYAAGSQGLPVPLPELPVQFADFAAWQRRLLDGEGLAPELAYWRERLAGAPAFVLPPDFPHRPEQPVQPACLPVGVDPELTQRLAALAHAASATLFMAVLASFQAVLALHTGRYDLVAGSNVANRSHLETEGLIGCFINVLVLRPDLSGDPTFEELLRRVREVTLEAFAHQDLPFDRLVQELEPSRIAGRTPLFQVKVDLLPATPPVEISELRLRLFDTGRIVARYDFHLSLVEEDGGLRGDLFYDAGRFAAATMDRLRTRFGRLLAEAVRTPGARLSELGQRLDAAEIAQRQERRQELGRANLASLRQIRRHSLPKAMPDLSVETET